MHSPWKNHFGKGPAPRAVVPASRGKELVSQVVLSVLLVFGLSCHSPSHRIVVGSKNFTEQLVLGELLAQQIERTTGQPVDRHFYLAGTYIAHQAITAGRIDVYVEYTGTALTAILNQPPSSSHEQVYREVKDSYARKFGLTVMPQLGFNNSFAIVVRGEDASRLHLKTISDLAAHAPRLRMGVGYEFIERPDGYSGLARTYGLKFGAAPRTMDLGLIYRALKEHEVDVIAGSNTDPQILAMGLVVLDDDKNYFPPYDAVPVIRSETLERYPRAGEALNRLAGAVSTKDIRKMNYEVDVQHKDVKDVVAEFLQRRQAIGN